MKHLLRKTACRLIEGYQARGGGHRFFGIDCNFEPSCSEYARQAISRYGLLKALPIVVRRLRRCTNPDLVQKIDDPLFDV